MNKKDIIRLKKDTRKFFWIILVVLMLKTVLLWLD